MNEAWIEELREKHKRKIILSLSELEISVIIGLIHPELEGLQDMVHDTISLRELKTKLEELCK